MTFEECSCGKEATLKVEFSIKKKGTCWYSMTGYLCEECFIEQKGSGAWRPKMGVGMEFSDCSKCKKKKEECEC